MDEVGRTVAGLSEGIQARLKELGEAFLEELPRRTEDIAQAAKNALAQGAGLAESKELRHHAHKLAGSAATFGFLHVTTLAKRLEHLLDSIMAEERGPQGEELKQVRMLVSELSESGRRGSPEGELEVLEEVDAAGRLVDQGSSGNLPPEGDESSENRLVALLLRDAEQTELFRARFTFYGFEVMTLRSPAEISSLSSNPGHVALVVDTGFMEEDPTVADAAYGLRNAAASRMQIVYLSDHDDFETRLLGVRSAGSAFFSTPHDINRIIDTVDGLTSGGGGEPYHVLIVDDDTEQVSYHALILQNAGMITSVVSDPKNMFAVLIEAKPDLILMDMYMPGCSGPELASIIRQQEAFVGIPIVFLSVETDENKQFEALSRGADGFLMKPIKSDHLVTAVSHRVDRMRNMRFFMERDSLTGLLNHTNLMQNLATEVQRSERVGCPLCFVMIDIDHFKSVNDVHGHLTGDRVLKSLARLLNDRLRKTDVIGRYGGEEFGVVMFNVDTANASRILNGIRDDFSRLPHEAGDTQFTVTFSAGLAMFPDFDGPGPISEAADKALYRAKETGRNRVVVARPTVVSGSNRR